MEINKSVTNDITKDGAYDFMEGQGYDDDVNVYEIYTKDPVTGTTGWDIHFVECHHDHIKSYPNFDCIISRCL